VAVAEEVVVAGDLVVAEAVEAPLQDKADLTGPQAAQAHYRR
jgi:hypothetical protein